MIKRILLTGFSAFEGETVNPTLQVINKFHQTCILGVEIIAKELPVVHKKAGQVMAAYIQEFDPNVIVALGQAGGRSQITPERVAINLANFRIADNEGNQPQDEPLIASAPVAYWSTLPIKMMVKRMRSGGIPAVVSNTAEDFVCNEVFYGLMHFLAQEGNIRQGGFMHIPYLPEQVIDKAGQPSMALSTDVQGLALSLEAIIQNKLYQAIG
jgi:pyroglutamyl-peptidase